MEEVWHKGAPDGIGAGHWWSCLARHLGIFENSDSAFFFIIMWLVCFLPPNSCS